VYTSISLLFDFLAFSLIIYWNFWVRKNGLRHKFATILDTVAEDSMWYFLLVFFSHFTLVMTMNLGRATIQLLPAPGLLTCLSVMVSRTLLSLRKAANSPHDTWSLVAQFPDCPGPQGTDPSRLQGGATWREDNIALDTHTEPECA